jgi:HEPN domain-containing protein
MVKVRTQKFKKEYSFKLFKIAKDDLYAAKILSSAPACRPETIVYHVQQCVEKCIKSTLIYLEKPIVLTHDIDALISELPEEYSTKLPQGSGELSQFATIKRYLDGDELIEEKDIK